MQPLEKTLRAKLERTIREARDIAEAAANAALKQLGVDEAEPFFHSTDSERALRRRLRAHGRQLGDSLNGDKVQSMDRLAEEVAYEHWHRMLFARFLTENNLLMYPDVNNPVPVTLEECEDLAEKENVRNGWELAARFAARMLPQIFRVESPVFQLILPPEHQQKLERLVTELSAEVFLASDSLGWVYQFWQAKKKIEVNASEVKIGARELPTVTQLFTEQYMVSFLLDNSLGAWWAVHRLTKTDLATASTEEELRAKASLPSMPLEYLRFVRGKNDIWVPAAGRFDDWPKSLRELKVIDPCCGSGHFLVAAFMMLVSMRVELEKLSNKDAVDSVLQGNLNGLEIDRRCVELAAFALALAAWRFPGAGGYRQLPELNVACCGLAISDKKEDWLALAGDNFNLNQALQTLYEQFKDAPVLGSLINPDVSLAKGTLFEVNWEKVAPTLNTALFGEKDDEKTEMGVVAQGIAKAAQLLSGKYNLVITNVPYLARGKQSDILREYFEEHYSESKNDLATVFLDRCLTLCVKGGTSSIVLPQNWLFLRSYRKLREKLLRNETWQLIARLGPQAFQTPMWDYNVQLMIISRGNVMRQNGVLPTETTSNLIHGLDVSESRNAAEKTAALLSAPIKSLEQTKQLENPDARIMLEEEAEFPLLENYASNSSGCLTSDGDRFYRNFWEQKITTDWELLQTTVSHTNLYDGRNLVLFWQNASGDLFNLAEKMKGTNHAVQNWRRGQDVWRKKGIAISSMGLLPVTLYDGFHFDNNTAVIIPNNPSHLSAIWCFCSSTEYTKAVRHIDQSLKVTNATLVKVPFDLEGWTKVAEEEYPNGLPRPYSDDPTQWIYHGFPTQSDEPLQIAVARLLGYRWPAELDSKMELSSEAHAWIKKSESLLKFADEDGIVCIPSVGGEMKAEDRLENLLAAAYGSDWSSSKKSELLAQVGYTGKTIESWLRERFFSQHCEFFHNRPFIWHVWDGLSDGFAALMNYHKLDAKKLEALIYTYLGDWISRQKQDIINSVDGAEEKLAAAEGLKKRLELILEGEAPYDIFVRWKSLEKQPVGWNPDLNDGVRLNIRPFLNVPDVGKKDAGVLRDKPNVKWDKDRGKDVESSPWYRLFKGERINDHHLTLSEKKKAMEPTK